MRKIKTTIKLRALLCCIAIGIMGYSCSDNSCCTSIDVTVGIRYQNSDGEFVINNSDEYNESSIKLYYKNGDEFEYFYNGNLTYSKGYRIDTASDSSQVLTIFPSYYYEESQSTTVIELNENHIDTLRCEFDLSDNSEVVTSVWFNGVKQEGRIFTVSI
ncbi:MAG: hypothetical protein P1U56_03170 [Saprospiraceae bacterium]|nr:hypothetical protein [Saprospiraceae bacterium]